MRGRNLYTLKVWAIVYMRTLFKAKSRQDASNVLRNLSTSQARNNAIKIVTCTHTSYSHEHSYILCNNDSKRVICKHSVYICTYIHTYVYTYIRTYVHTYIHTYHIRMDHNSYSYTCMHVRTLTHTHTCTCTHTNTLTRTHAPTYTHAHTHTHVHMHAHT